MKQEAEKLRKKTRIAATKLVPATKKENTTETSEGAGWVVPTIREEVEEKKVEKTAEGVVLKEDPKYLAGAIQLNAEGKWNLFSTRSESQTLQHRFPIYEQAHQE